MFIVHSPIGNLLASAGDGRFWCVYFSTMTVIHEFILNKLSKIASVSYQTLWACHVEINFFLKSLGGSDVVWHNSLRWIFSVHQVMKVFQRVGYNGRALSTFAVFSLRKMLSQLVAIWVYIFKFHIHTTRDEIIRKQVTRGVK